MRNFIFIFISGILLLSSCSEYQQIVKSTDFDLKFEKAVEYYQEKDYYKAQTLLEELLTLYKGTARAEEVYYYYAYCYYGFRDYILAGYHFSSFVSTFPNSKHAEECNFKAAYCYYLQSPKSSLDQSYTVKAIDELQLHINRYPLNLRVSECNELIDTLRGKLQEKSFNNAKLYYNLGDYKASLISLNNCIKEYPDTKFREDLLFLILDSSYLLASKSVESKKKERFQSVVTEYYTLIDEFPETAYKKEAEHIYEKTLKEINNF